MNKDLQRLIDSRKVAFPSSLISLDDGGSGEGGNGDVVGGGAPVQWHQIALEGEFDGHHSGPFKITTQDFDQMETNFKAVQTDMVVDYEHNTLNPFAAQAPAAGWISALDQRDTSQGRGLFGKVAWTTKAASHIRAKEYRYFSPVLVFTTRDRKSGADRGTSIHSVALTNTPFLDELPEATLNRLLHDLGGLPPITTKGDAMTPEQMAALAEFLGLTKSATADQIMSTVALVARDVTALTGIAGLLELDEGASGSQILGAVTALRDQSAIATAQLAEFEGMRDQVAKIAAADRIAKAREAGKIVKQNEGWALGFAAKDPEAFDAWATSAPSIVPTTVVQPPAPGAPRVTTPAKITDEDRQLAEKAGMTPEDFVKYANFNPATPEQRGNLYTAAAATRKEG